MFSDIMPCGTTLKLWFYIDLTYHILLGHMKVCLSCTKVCLSCTMTVIIPHCCSLETSWHTALSGDFFRFLFALRRESVVDTFAWGIYAFGAHWAASLLSQKSIYEHHQEYKKSLNVNGQDTSYFSSVV